MRFVIQQVSNATVTIHTEKREQRESIAQGAIVYVAISNEDLKQSEASIHRFAQKIQTVKLFTGESGRLDSSLRDIAGELLLISNFTLFSRNKKGNGVDYAQSAPFDESKKIYLNLVQECHKNNILLKTGEFGAKMSIQSTVVGPVNHIREW